MKKEEKELQQLSKQVEDIILERANMALWTILREVEKIQEALNEAHEALELLTEETDAETASKLKTVAALIKMSIKKL